jgi:pyridoxine 4-dehydrogenase
MEKQDSRTFIKIGDYSVYRIGLGTNRVKDGAAELLKHAVRIGINFIDTADIYQGGASERAIGNALFPYNKDLVIATKGGMVPGAPANNSPAHLSKVLENSLKSLRTYCITLYQLHRVNNNTPLEETMNFFKQAQSDGKIKYIGLSEVTVEQIETARKYAEIVTVQNHYNLGQRKHEDVIDYCEKNNVVFIPFFPLGIAKLPVNKINEIAEKYTVTTQQILLAWLLKRSPAMLPIPGTLSVSHADENLAALNIKLSDEDYNILSSIK